MKNKNVIIAGLLVIVSIVIMVFVSKEGKVTKNVDNLMFTEVKKGKFEVAVLTTGELQAENYSEISAPPALQSRTLRINSIKITDLVSEGTLVTKGDYVATLDKTDLDNTLKNEYDALTTAQTNLETKMLDTAVTLSNARDNIKNIDFSLEDAKIVLEQSKYEPPATIRKAEMNLDKVQRSLEQSISNYELKVQQSVSDIKLIELTLSKQQQKVNELESVLNQFVITAPADGMVIYKKNADGTKRSVNSTISSFDLVVATLPDLNTMVSKTYVNEIDVNKVRVGQKVRLIIDAFSDRNFTGEVISVSNIGEQLPSANAKVFEVFIRVNETDDVLRPAMTSGNIIITQTINDAVYIPIGSIDYENGKTFVYTKDKKKVEVTLGISDESNIVVENGIEPGTIIYADNPTLIAKN